MSDSRPVKRLLNLLRTVRPTADGWMACCPAHRDSTPSLSISEGEDGKVLVCCHANCSAESVVAAVGLSMSDLFQDKQLAPVPCDLAEEVYQYRDLSGRPLFEVVRHRSVKGQKSFFQRRYHKGRLVRSLKAGRYKLSDDGSYRPLKQNEATDGSIELPAVEKVLYRLPEIQAAIRDGNWLVVCEGEKDADNSAKLGLATTTNPGGAGKWQGSYSRTLRGARIAIVPDNDVPGRASAAKIEASLRKQGNEVCVVELGGTAKGYDLSDWIADLRQAGRTDSQIHQAFLQKVELAAKLQPRPRVVITANRLEVTDQAVALLGNRPEFYRKGGELVQIISADLADAGNQSAAPVICAATPARIIEILSDCADWILPKGIPGPPPDWLAKTILGRGQWPQLRRLEGVVGFPVLRADGTIIETSDYDVSTGLVYQPISEYPPLPSTRDEEAARQAGRRLREVVVDFPFESEADFSAWLAGLFTILARYAFTGPSPLFIVDANLAGAGKTMLVDVISQITLGAPAPRMAQAENDAEERKRITSVLLEGRPIVLIDNVDRRLGSACLDSVLTGTTWTDRKLGGNQQVTLPQKAVFFATGNNIRLKGDTHRRNLAIQLIASSDSPDRRTDFRQPRLLDWVAENRPALLMEALTVLASYFEAGRPQLVAGSWGSYEGWSAVVRNAVVWAGFPDPCEKRDAVQIEVESDEVVEAQVLEAWQEAEQVSGGPMAISQIQGLMESEAGSNLSQALIALCGKRAGHLPSPREIGNRFKALQGRTIDGKRLSQVGKKGSLGMKWTVKAPNGEK